MKGLKYGLHLCLVDKSKSIKRNIAVELENIAHLVQKDVSSENMEYFHEYLRKITNRFTQNSNRLFGCCYELKKITS